MSNWLSSKLKVAETFLQQIDQQAADSLGKGEKAESEELNHIAPKVKTESALTPLKDQLKKKNVAESNDFVSVLKKEEAGSPPKPPSAARKSVSSISSLPSNPPSLTEGAKLTDTDWTQLLSTPERKPPSPSPPVRNGVSTLHGKKLLELKKNQRGQGGIGKTAPVATRKSGVVAGNKVNGVGGNGERKRSDGEDSGSGESVKAKTDEESRNSSSSVDEKQLDTGKKGVTSDIGITPVSVEVGGIVESVKKVPVNREPEAPIRSTISDRDLVERNSVSSDGTSGSDSDSSSTSDSEKERERKEEKARRREHILAEKAAAKAVEVIKEQENIVARLEGEKQSLEKILEERAKQQAQEASELQMSMMETMDAVDLEKQKHNNTRMEAFARLAKLETANAELAKSLASTQRNLEIEGNHVAELRHQIELKEASQEDLKRKITEIHQSGSSLNQSEASKGVEFEREILEAEYSLACDKIGQLLEKEKKLEENIDMLQKEMEVPTEVEVELKRRLSQLTNHLIQKQSQVEALSSEKATLLFRIETVSRLVEEQMSAPQLFDMAGPSVNSDLEAGAWEGSKDKLRPLFADKIQSGSQHLGSLLRQLDAIFSAGAAFIRRNPQAKLVALFYLVILHFWVSYIFTSHSQASDTTSGAVVSLENINKTTGS